MSEKVIWTLCPQGRLKNGLLKVGVFVSPRLVANGPGATIAQWPAWTNWAETIEGCEFGIHEMAAGKKVGNPIIGVRKSRVIPEVYTSLFPPKTPVKDYVFKNLEGKLIFSYPVKKLNDLIEHTYLKLALSGGEDLPRAPDLIAAGWPGYLSPTERRQLNYKGRPPRQRLFDALRKQTAEEIAKAPHALLDLFSHYHKPLLKEKTFTHKGTPENGHEDVSFPGFERPTLPNDATLVARTDFHKIAAALSGYNELSRYCGLVIELEVPFDPAFTGTRTFAIHVKRKGAPVNPAIDICPGTICVIAPKQFAAEDDTATLDNGFAVIEDRGLDLIQMDVDGAAHKAIGLAGSLDTMRVSAFSDDGTLPVQAGIASSLNQSSVEPADQAEEAAPQAGAPSLRTGGLMLAKSLRHVDVENGAKRAAALDNGLADGAVPPLNALDLLRGYRVDIIDMSQAKPAWRSLHRRNIHYRFLNPLDKTVAIDLGWDTTGAKVTGTSPEEEGMIGTALGSSPDGSVPDVYKLHEGVFVWRGWSLSAPEPFKVLTTPESDPSKEPDIKKAHAMMVGENDGDVPDGLPIKATYTVALEYTRTMPPVPPPPPRGTLPALRFGHVYQARLRAVDLTGTSVSHRDPSSDKTLTPPVMYRRYEPIESPVITLVGDMAPAAQSCNYKHTDHPLQGESMDRMALRSYYDETAKTHPPAAKPKVARNLAPPRVVQRFAETHGAVDDATGKPRPDLYETLCRQDAPFPVTEVPPADYIRPLTEPVPATTKASRYSVSRPQFALPYLPDPWAIGIKARFKALGDTKWQDETITLYDAFSGTVSPQWPHSRPVMIVGSESFTDFAYNSGTRTLEVPMPKGCRQRVRLSSLIPDGAVDQMALWALMFGNNTFAKLAPAMRKTIVEGRHWMFTPWREIELVHATQKPLIVPGFDAFTAHRGLGEVPARLNIRTPLSGRSTGRLDILAGWNEPDDNAVNLGAKSGPIARAHRDIAAQLPIARLDGFPDDRYLARQVPHIFQDTRARRVEYRMDAISRFKEFFEKPLRDSDTAMKVTSSTAIQWIPSSAPPPAPSVLYVIPTFGWLQKGGKLPASRRTAGLRVYLDRPWLVTGFNEMLAVILPNEPNDTAPAGDAAGNQPFVTQWGRDPLRVSTQIATNSPRRSTFRLALSKGPVTAPGAGLPAEEGQLPNTFQTRDLTVPGQEGTIAVAPHEVGYDKDRQLWYADIAVNIPRGSYFPFIRLAVARYQPNSVDGAHLSPAVTCDFMQISPDRIAVIVPINELTQQYRVFVYGDQPHDSSLPARARRGVVRVQTQVLDDGLDPILGWRDAWGEPFNNPNDKIPKPFEDKKAPVEDTSPAQAAARARELADADIGEAKRPVRRVQGERIVSDQMRRSVLPELIYEETFYAPAIPAGGQRRLLITETETFSQTLPADKNGHSPLTSFERIVYAEGIGF